MYLGEFKALTSVEHAWKALFWPGADDIHDKLVNGLAKKGFVQIPLDVDGVVAFAADQVERLVGSLSETLNIAERKATKALLFDGETPALSDFGKVSTVEHIVHMNSSLWLIQLLEDRRYRSMMQPIVSAGETEIHGYEFLFRGMETDGQLVPPAEMFRAAGEGDVLVRLDSTAQLSAIKTAARFGLVDKVFINVLPASLAEGATAFQKTLQAIDDTKLAADQIVFEIVESQAIEDPLYLSTMIQAFRESGYRIALDDFGSGYNNLTTMVQLKPDYIKLDKALIGRINEDAQTWNLVANMIDAAKENRILVIAEGVEEEETVRKLQTLGADFLQGFYFGAPADKPSLLDS